MVILINPTDNMPYNLMYLAAYLREYGVKVRIFTEKMALGYIRYNKPEIIGISDMFTAYHDKTIEIAKQIKKMFPYTKIVVGGNHASIDHNNIPDCIDQIVVGEGEQAFLDICRGENSRIVKRDLIDIDSIPMPAYDMVDVEHYIRNGNPFAMRKRTMGIISSRGCPNSCTYCSIGHVWGRSWRGRHHTKVVDEIEHLQKEYNVHEFSFLDDSMSIDRERLFNICYELIRRKLNIRWSTPNGIAHWTLDKALLETMYESGCYRITFGIESGSKDIRKSIRKSYPLSQAEDLIRYANNLGLWTITTNIIGLPFEEEKDIEETLQFAINCDTDFACFYTFIPHIGTDAYENRDQIRIKEDRLLEIQRQLYRRFLLSRVPSAFMRMTKKIATIEDAAYVARLLRMGLGVLLNTFKQGGHVIYG